MASAVSSALSWSRFGADTKPGAGGALGCRGWQVLAFSFDFNLLWPEAAAVR